MRAFIDKRCPRGHRYGWLGGPGDDPGCAKCAEDARLSALRPSNFPPSAAVPDWFGAFVADVQTEQGGIDRDAALRAIMRRWGTRP